MDHEITPITDAAEIQRLDGIARRMTEKAWAFQVDWLKRRDLRAVPLWDRYIGDAIWEHLDRYVTSVRSQGITLIYAVPLLSAVPPRVYAKLPISATAIEKFWREEIIPLPYVLFDENESHALLLTMEDYELLAGSDQFFEAFLSGTFDEVFSSFHGYLMSFPDSMQPHLQWVSDICRSTWPDDRAVT